MPIDTALFYTALPQLLSAALISMQVALVAFTIGITGGTAIALLQAQNIPIINFVSTLYVSLIRGTPMLIQITFFYYVLPVIGITLSPFWAACLAIGLNSTAYMSQIIKSGISSVGKDQTDAAQALGFSRMQTIQYIIMPQAIRTVFPALVSECITLIKDSSLASILGVMELYKTSRVIMNQTYDVVTVFCLVAFCYLLLTTLAEAILRTVEKRIIT